MTITANVHNAFSAHTAHNPALSANGCPAYSSLSISALDGSEVTIFGPPSAMDAFDRAADIINEALLAEREKQRDTAE